MKNVKIKYINRDIGDGDWYKVLKISHKQMKAEYYLPDLSGQLFIDDKSGWNIFGSENGTMLTQIEDLEREIEQMEILKDALKALKKQYKSKEFQKCLKEEKGKTGQ